MVLSSHHSTAGSRPSVADLQSSSTPLRTPTRTASSLNFSSPSSLRAEEESLILEIGSRYLRLGFAGDCHPKAIIAFKPEDTNRAGDYRQWQAGYKVNWQRRRGAGAWGKGYQLWDFDVRNADLALISDRIEKCMRDALTHQLAIGSTKAGSRDNAVRKIALTLPPGFPLPLLSTVLDTLFIHFEPPSISLLSAPMLSTMAAGVRDAIVVDIGWCETTVTAVYECREISTKRSTRAMKLLVKHMAALLKNETKSEHSNVKISFEECEDITSRLCWCKSSSASGGDLYTASQCAGLEDNGQLVSGTPASTGPRQKLKFPLKRATEPCETALFAENVKESELDDEELPVHLLLYNSLLHLPVDVRSVCMSRVIITGGGSNIPGLKTRIINEVRSLVCQRGWDVVRRGGHCSAIAGSKVARRPHSSTVPEPQGALDDPTAQQAGIGADAEQGLAGIAAPHSRQPRNIDADLHKHREKNRADDSLGSLQGIDSMGSWAGASLLCQMRIAAVSVVHKDQWLQHGLAGASKSKEVVPLTKQRQSMGPTGLRVAAAASEQASWTLGQWA